jgi:hypothetical protein
MLLVLMTWRANAEGVARAARWLGWSFVRQSCSGTSLALDIRKHHDVALFADQRRMDRGAASAVEERASRSVGIGEVAIAPLP